MRTLVGRGVDHEQEALFSGRELRDVVVRMRTSDMLLHGAITLFLWADMVRSGSLADIYRLKIIQSRFLSHFRVV